MNVLGGAGGRTGKLAAMLCVFAGVTTASAACFEDIGCTESEYMRVQDLRRLSCENLWLVRNTIFDENGFCFRTKRARSMFSNDDCWVSAQADVELNDYERSNVGKIAGVESSFGC